MGGGAPIFAIIYTQHIWNLYALEGSRGMLPQNVLKSKALNDAS